MADIQALIERRVPVDQYLFKPDDHEPLDAEGLQWLADQLCSETRVHEDRTMSTGWIPYQAAYEFPHLLDELTRLSARVEELEGAAEDEFNRGFLVAVSSLIGGWGESTESEHLLREIHATPEMVKRLGMCEYDQGNLLPALSSTGGDNG